MFSLDRLRGLNDVITLREYNELIMNNSVGRVCALFKYDRRAWNRETDLFSQLRGEYIIFRRAKVHLK